MATKIDRIGIVGASSLMGKELADELAESPLAAASVALLDDEETSGQLTATGDELALIQKLDASSFEGLDFAFFTDSADVTREQWQHAREAGASIVDLTGALEAEPEVLVCAPWVAEGKATGKQPDLQTPAMVVAHPVAVMLGLAAERLARSLPVVSVAATVIQPASEYGRAAMDELHQQTVSLLSFQELPKEQFDAQLSFNLLPVFGESAKAKGADHTGRILRQYRGLAGGELPELSLQLVHAPVFHGYVISALVELREAASVAQVERALAGAHVDLVSGESEPPSNLTAAGQPELLVRVSSSEDGPTKRIWVWMAADNLKVTALNAIACAVELRKLRPQGKVQ